MSLLQIYSGDKNSLQKKDFEDGSVYFVTDTQEIYADIPGQHRQPFGGQSNDNNPEIDKDELYAYILKKMLSDPAAIFQGASPNSDSLPGLVPPLPD